MFCGKWETEAVLDEPICSALYLRLLAACDFSPGPPGFCFHPASRTQGMKLVHQLNGCSGEKFRNEPAGIGRMTQS